jgi:hypothetical protein
MKFSAQRQFFGHYFKSLGNPFFRISYKIAFILILQSCAPLVFSSSNNYYNKNVETFFVGEDGTQFFIKPILFKNKISKTEFKIDFTFRYKDQVKDSVITNFSLISNITLKKINSLTIHSKSNSITGENIKLLYNDKIKNNLFVSRFSIKLPLSEIIGLFKSAEWDILIKTEDLKLTFESKNKSFKIINTIYDHLFLTML